MSMPVHRFETAEGIRWHWAEMGDGDPVVLLHGIPESWMCWKHQMPTLATQFRVLAFDLKGYGRSEKADGDYTGNGVARELLACLDKIGIERFRLAGHDWGVIVGIIVPLDGGVDHACRRSWPSSARRRSWRG